MALKKKIKKKVFIKIISTKEATIVKKNKKTKPKLIKKVVKKKKVKKKKVVKKKKKKVKKIKNPRIEKEEHYYNPSYQGLVKLGVRPNYLTKNSIQRMMKIVNNYRENIHLDNI